ncbi:MAG: DUF4178 domain-containing protein [Gemmatimonadetes bacterium]|nr:DUF4178 domain-containing protein [Gemmatimonadota bacterium]
MTGVRASCPNCGAQIDFRWAQAVQTTCAYCQSVLVRRDLDLEKVGTSAVPPLTPSPIQLGTEGRFGNTAFTVVGRLVYRWSGGGWSEWHCRCTDDTSAWLSDAQAEYVFTRQAAPERPLPRVTDMRVGERIKHHGQTFSVTSITEASYVGTEGELPFAYEAVAQVLFIDLRGDAGDFATIDGSEDPPLLFVGQPVELRQLELRNLREFEGW